MVTAIRRRTAIRGVASVRNVGGTVSVGRRVGISGIVNRCALPVTAAVASLAVMAFTDSIPDEVRPTPNGSVGAHDTRAWLNRVRRWSRGRIRPTV